MGIMLIILMIIVGLVLLILEVLVLPGFIAGICGVGLLLFAIWQAFMISQVTGFIVLFSTLCVSVILILLMMKAKTWKKVTLDTKIDSKVNLLDTEKIKVGDTGKTISRLAPMGRVSINGENIEASTYNEFIEQNTDIEIINIEENKIYVKQLK